MNTTQALALPIRVRPLTKLARYAMVAVFGVVAPAQFGWTEQSFVPRWNPCLAFDHASQRMLSFGGATPGSLTKVFATSFWDGQRWTAPSLAVQPRMRWRAAMCADMVRQRIVLFGGQDPGNAFLGDTWEWDGTRWLLLSVSGPPPLGDHAMVFDALRGVTVLFGGTTAFAVVNATWEWNGTSWLQRNTPVAPLARQGHAMAYDLFRARVVLHGGNGFGDTWEWNGQQWLQKAVPFLNRTGHTMVFDPQVGAILMFGGTSNSTTPTDGILAWNGRSWSAVPSPSPPPGRGSSAMAYDWSRSRTVLAGGVSALGPSSDTWELDGTTWTASEPQARFDSNMVFDPVAGQTILFGGTTGSLLGPYVLLDDTWARRDGLWRQLQPSTRPPARGGAGFAFDAARGNAVLFGGGPVLADTWIWTGADWQQMQPAVSPPGRFLPAMAYDAAHQEVVMFGGGTTPTAVLQDTWIWNGTTWTQRFPAHTPSGRRSAAIAFDIARQNTVMFGGTGFNILGDTWIWNGIDWSAGPQSTGRSGASMTYDPARQRVLMMFGQGTTGFLDSVSEWNGSAWSAVATPGSRRVGMAAAFDAALRRTVGFGGQNGTSILGDTWEYGYARPFASEPFGVGCSGTVGIPSLRTQAPLLGIGMAVSVNPTLPGSAGQVAVGFSNTHDGSVALPLALDSLGMPGCRQYVSLEQWQATTSVGPTAMTTLTIPSLQSLLGLTFYCQALIADPAANSLGLTVSNAVACLIGTP